MGTFYCIKQTLPLEVAAHIWDVYLFEGEMYLMCVALGILKLYAPRWVFSFTELRGVSANSLVVLHDVVARSYFLFVGILCCESVRRLSMMSMERVSPFLLHLPEDIKPDELFNCIAQIKLSRKRYDRIRLKVCWCL